MTVIDDHGESALSVAKTSSMVGLLKGIVDLPGPMYMIM